MKPRFAVLFAAASLCTILPGCSDDKPKEAVAEAPLTYQDTVDATVTAKVKALNYDKRTVTLEDAAGHWMTYSVDNSVKRFKETMVGDDVRVSYRATLFAELRSATPGEAVNPITVTESESRAGKSSSPSHTTTQVTKVVTTVEAIDIPNMRVTLRGPMGDTSVVKAKKEENIKRLKVGDTIVMTFTESLVMSLDKIAAR